MIYSNQSPISARVRLIFAGLLAASTTEAANAGTLTVIGHAPGVTPFVQKVTASYGGGTIGSVSYTIAPKAGSQTRPVKFTYSAAALRARGLLAVDTVTIPVSFLYAGRANTVNLEARFTDRTIASATTSVDTPAYSDPCGKLGAATIQNNRTRIADIGFDYFVLSNYCSSDAPAIVDTDGEPRWVAHTGIAGQPGLFYRSGVYTTDGGNGVNRTEFDGTVKRIGNYGGYGVTYTGHHNFDPGRDGIVLDVNTTTQTESVNIEIDWKTGAVLNRWDMADIISAAMVAGGDDPSGFVKPVGTDWFHNNATAYNPADNTLIVSGRETFVIAVDYDTPADGVKKIHWILGDETKLWATYPSLRKYSLKLVGATLPPIGQHAPSIDHLGNLLLFDDGQGSFNQSPAGITRNYSAARSYKIDAGAMTATEIFTYDPRDKFSFICGSVYEGAAGQYLVDYSQERAGFTELRGLGPKSKLVFTIKYPLTGACGPGWNARPLKTQTFVIAS